MDKKTEYDEYIGKYVVIFPMHSSSFLGRIKEVNEDWVILQPFVGLVYSQDGLAKRLIEDKPSKIRRSDIIAIEPTTRESLEAFCNYTNKEIKDKKSD